MIYKGVNILFYVPLTCLFTRYNWLISVSLTCVIIANVDIYRQVTALESATLDGNILNNIIRRKST